MRNSSILSLVALLGCSTANAIVTVDGVGGGATNFATLVEAVDYCANNASEDTIEIITNGPLSGVDMFGITLPTPLTIRAGQGFTPLINADGLWLRPTNESATTVTIENVGVVLPDATSHSLFVGCNVEAVNCEFTQPGVSPWQAAVTCATPTNSTNSELHMTSCSVSAHHAIQAGRAVQDIFLTSCTVRAVSNIGQNYQACVSHNLNWRPNFGAEYSQEGLGLPPIQTPRNLYVDTCNLYGGRFLSWPSETLGASYTANQQNTIGDVTMINSVLAVGVACPINNINLPPEGNDPTVTFQHCTFRKANDLLPHGVLYPQTTSTLHISNCLFDIPFSNYCMAAPTGAGPITLEGDNNAYNMFASVQTSNFSPPFETTFYRRDVANNTDHVTAPNGDIFGDGFGFVAARAKALIPPVLTDKDLQPRPQPIGALANDIGADEIVDPPSAVTDWELF